MTPLKRPSRYFGDVSCARYNTIAAVTSRSGVVTYMPKYSRIGVSVSATYARTSRETPRFAINHHVADSAPAPIAIASTFVARNGSTPIASNGTRSHEYSGLQYAFTAAAKSPTRY